MQNLIQKIKDLIELYKAYQGLKQIVADMAPEFKQDIQNLAKDVDELIAKVQASPSEIDDQAIPLLTSISVFLKKISA